MAKNSANKYRKFRYYEGVCSSGDFLKELAKVLSLGVKNDSIKDDDGNLVQGSPIRDLNWDIVYPLVDRNFDPGNGDIKLDTRDNYNVGVQMLEADKYIEKLNNQINQITDKVVLRTTSTLKEISEDTIDDLSVSGDSEMAQHTMYVEFVKPKYLANPEDYPLDVEEYGITPQCITKEMYKNALTSKIPVIYTLSNLLEEGYDPLSSTTKNFITKETQKEYVDRLSNAYAKDELFGDGGVLENLQSILGVTNLYDVFPIPIPNSRTTQVFLNKTQLNTLKYITPDLYEFICSICGLKYSFTEKDYDAINDMTLKVTLYGDSDYYVTLTYEKEVTIYTLNPSKDFDVKEEFEHDGISEIKLELYSEGRYIPIPKKYISSITINETGAKLTMSDKAFKFCPEKVVDENINYGEVVIRFSYKNDFVFNGLESFSITDSVEIENNHYCIIRMFDNPNTDFSGPDPNIVDSNGNVTITNSHASPWSKLSWYQDFEEIAVDSIDEDSGNSSISDGNVTVPLITPGLTSDTRLSYWINTNNDRFSLIVMGNPALDYTRERHLISSCYIGTIDSFENSINDVSGNFALYTSSSTVPCKTVIEPYDTYYHMNRDFNNSLYVTSNSEREANIEAYKHNSELINGAYEVLKASSNGFDVYYVSLPNNIFFIEDEIPRYMILDKDDNPILLRGTSEDAEDAVFYDTVAYRRFNFSSTDDKPRTVELYVNPLPSNAKKILFNFGYYEERFTITSGITKDAFGNVLEVANVDDYGINTSDGTLSVSMYHTRSKAYYQKHHFLFATTEEFMSKVLYGKSSYTGEYYADRVKITHGNDGPRGMLSDVLVIDSSSLYPKDELVINKDFSKAEDELEETFMYFPVTAPYSPLADGPNARYGFALKKAEKEPSYADDEKILDIAESELNVRMGNIRVVKNPVKLPQQTDNGCNIYWSVVTGENKNWIEDKDNIASSQIEIKYPGGATKKFVGRKYAANNVDIVVDGFEQGKEVESMPNKINVTTVAKGSNKTVDFKSEIDISVAEFTPNSSINKVFYGYSDSEIRTLRGGTVLTSIIDDGTNEEDRYHEYAFNEFYTDIHDEISLDGIKTDDKISNFTQEIYNAHPDKYLNIFFTCNSDEPVYENTDIYNKEIKSFISIPLHYEHSLDDNDQYAVGKSYFDLLQYPCSVTLYTSGVTDNNEQGILNNGSLYNRVVYDYQEYNTGLSFNTQNMNGAIRILQTHYTENVELTNGGSGGTVESRYVLDDIYVNINAR